MLTFLFNYGINLPHRFKIQSTCCADLGSSPTFLCTKPLRAHTTGTNIRWRRSAPKKLYTKTQIHGHSWHPTASMHGYWAHRKTITNATFSMFQKQEDTGYQGGQQTCSPKTAWPLSIHPNCMSRSSPKSFNLTSKNWLAKDATLTWWKPLHATWSPTLQTLWSLPPNKGWNKGWR